MEAASTRLGFRTQHLALRECFDATGINQADDVTSIVQRQRNVFAPAARRLQTCVGTANLAVLEPVCNCGTPVGEFATLFEAARSSCSNTASACSFKLSSCLERTLSPRLKRRSQI